MKTCLIIDDSDVIREIVARIVEGLGFKPHEAGDAVDAIEFCRSTKPDIVLLDWDLPSIVALDFLRVIGGFEAGQKPKIVLCATENNPKQFALARAAGAEFHILKPYDHDAIARAFAEAGVLDADEAGSAINDIVAPEADREVS